MMEAIINGIKLRYDDQGSGPAVLLIHAFPLSGAIWRQQIEALRERYRVIAPDLRGFGGSDAPPGPASMDLYADDLIALLDHLGLNKVAVCGVSMGGYIAFALLRRHAERLRALILCDTRAGADSDEARAGREANARLAEEQGPGAIADSMIPKLVASAASDELRATLRTIIEANSSDGIAAALRGMAQRPDSTPDLAAITVPTLVIVGSEDTLTPPSEAHRLHAGIAGSRLAEISGAGHLPNLERVVDFNRAVLAFLESALKPAA